MAQFDFGMIGLGVMGSNLLLNMADHGFAVIGFDLKPERGQALEAAAEEGTTVKGVATMPEMVLALKKPRKIMMLVPAGKPVDDVIAALLPMLEDGDIVIDGGNSFYKDTVHRILFLQDKGIHFMGMGVSGGELGARIGPSMMPGGDKAAYEYLKPILEAIAAKADGTPCVAYMGNDAAGHYVKMVHNGIEYAMMQMIAEVYDLLRRGAGYTNPALHAVFKKWNEGSLQSFLMEVTADIFKIGDTETPGNPYRSDTGPGRLQRHRQMDLPGSHEPAGSGSNDRHGRGHARHLRIQAGAQTNGRTVPAGCAGVEHTGGKPGRRTGRCTAFLFCDRLCARPGHACESLRRVENGYSHA
jgi:6-phosphogluconate dehydrogenase